MNKRRKPIKLKNYNGYAPKKKNSNRITSIKRNVTLKPAINLKPKLNLKSTFNIKKINKSNKDNLNQDKVKTKMGKINFGVFYAVAVLICIGIVMITSASGFFALYTKGDIFFFIRNTLKYLVIGIIAMAITMSIDYHHYEKYTILLFLVTIVLLIVVLFQPDMNGATRWIYIGGFSFQPSEIAKYAIVFYLSVSLHKRKELNKSFIKGTLFYITVAGIFALLIERENNLSIASIVVMTTCILIYLGGVKLWNLVVIAIPGLMGVFMLIKLMPYRMARLTGFLDPWNDPTGDSFQLIQSFYALGSGGLTGRGIGESIIKYLYMPEPHNDFIFAIIGEELGLIGCVLIILMFIYFAWSGFKVSKRAVDEYGRLLSAGIVIVIILQAAINIAVVTGSMPVTGVPLPFVGYGGTSLVINMSAIGVLLNISRHKIDKNIDNISI